MTVRYFIVKNQSDCNQEALVQALYEYFLKYTASYCSTKPVLYVKFM